VSGYISRLRPDAYHSGRTIVQNRRVEARIAFGQPGAQAAHAAGPGSRSAAVIPSPIPRDFARGLGAVVLDPTLLALRAPAAQSAGESASDSTGLPFVGAKSRLSTRSATPTQSGQPVPAPAPDSPSFGYGCGKTAIGKEAAGRNAGAATSVRSLPGQSSVFVLGRI